MHTEQREDPNDIGVEETPDEWWYRVYAAVIVCTAFVITALWAFSRYFSK
jgi:hypothetical protein